MMDDLGNLGDFIGGIGVVVTLIYLAYQIKQNTSTVKVSTAAAFVQHSIQAHAFVAQNPEINRIFWVGLQTPETMTTEEYRYFESLISVWIQPFQAAFHFNEVGALADETWQQQVASINWVVTMPGFERYWESWGAFYNIGFTEFVTEIKNRSEATNT